jgi:hypothetical protein
MGHGWRRGRAMRHRVMRTALLITVLITPAWTAEPPRPVAGTGQDDGSPALRYTIHDDGTVTDLVTGLHWQRDADARRMTQDDAEAHAEALVAAGHDDWRLPTIAELFSLADLRGDLHRDRPYIDAAVFPFAYPDGAVDEHGPPGGRRLDAQAASSTRSVATTMGRDRSAFGFNLADGRIKAYPLHLPRLVRCVRGGGPLPDPRFVPGASGETVIDRATGLEWQRADAGSAMDARAADVYADCLIHADRDDWRLPTVKELQSIVDYRRSPRADAEADRGPAIDPAFALPDPDAWYWSATAHLENGGRYYVAFGPATSVDGAPGKRLDAHGAGAVRSDPPTGDPAAFTGGLGPQRDEVRIANRVRCVRRADP